MRKIKIVIIDNDTDFLEACRNLLEAAGHEVAVQSRERDALATVARHRPDLILLDIVMDTDHSGYDIAGALNANGDLKDIPVVFLTGFFANADAIERQKGLFAKWSNFRRVLEKPVKPALLLEAVSQIAAEK